MYLILIHRNSTAKPLCKRRPIPAGPSGEVDLLRELYGEVIIPPQYGELQAESTPAAVQSWLLNAPDWLKVRSARQLLLDRTALEALDAGEQEAIELTVELGADLLLMDDQDLPKTPTQLQASGFYLSARLRESVLDRHRQRHGITF
jgi:hypothetical protein